MSIRALIDELPEVLTDEELRELKRTTPRPRPREVSEADVAAVVERAWRTRFGKPTVVAEAVLAGMKRGGGS